MKDRKKWGIIILMFVIMTSIAVVENFKGVFVPFFKRDIGMLDSGIGIINGLGTFAYLIMSLVGSYFCEKCGQKKVFISGLALMAVSLVLFRLTGDSVSLYAVMFVFNSALALISIAINTIIPIIAVGFQAIVMNLTHLFYGAGASAAPFIGSKMVSNGFGWKDIYFYSAFVFIIIVLVVFRTKLPVAHKADGEKKKGYSKSGLVILILVSIALAFYVFAELETSTWLVNYLEQNFDYSIEKSAKFVSNFYIMLTIGRLLGGFIVEKIGYMKSVLGFLTAAAVTYFAGVLIGDKFIILVSISGLFFSVVYPTTLVIISNIFKEKSSTAIGFVVTVSSLIKMGLSFGFGALNQAIGSYKAFYFIPAALGVSIIFMILMSLKVRKLKIEA